jgi:hypothetical protein
MSKSIRRFVCGIAVIAALGILVPGEARSQSRGSRSGGPAHVGHPGQPARPAAVNRSAVASRANHSGPLSYNAYWRAAASPTPPRTNQDYNQYWQKMQAWQQQHPR